MKKRHLFEIVTQLLLAVLAVVLFVGSLIVVGSYYYDKAQTKTQITATVVANPKDTDDLILRYEFDGTTYYHVPEDSILHRFGNENTTRQIFVDNAHPKRIFLKNPPTGEFAKGTILLGWSLVLGLILLIQRRFYNKIRALDVVKIEEGNGSE